MVNILDQDYSALINSEDRRKNKCGSVRKDYYCGFDDRLERKGNSRNYGLINSSARCERGGVFF